MKPTLWSCVVLILSVFLVTLTLHGSEGVIGPIPWPPRGLARSNLETAIAR